MSRITLSRVEGNIVVELTDDGSGTITSDLKDTCPYCNQPFCLYSCDQSQADGSNEVRDGNGRPDERIAYNERINGVESLILACALAGVKIDSPEFQGAVQTTVDALVNASTEWEVDDEPSDDDN